VIIPQLPEFRKQGHLRRPLLAAEGQRGEEGKELALDWFELRENLIELLWFNIELIQNRFELLDFSPN
jgi:hypothetical protein